MIGRRKCGIDADWLYLPNVTLGFQRIPHLAQVPLHGWIAQLLVVIALFASAAHGSASHALEGQTSNRAVVMVAGESLAARAEVPLVVSAPTPAAIPAEWTCVAAGGFEFVPELHAALVGAEAVGTSGLKHRVAVPLRDAGEVVLELVSFRPTAGDARVEIGAAKRGPLTAVSSGLSATARQVAHFEGRVAGRAGSSCYLAVGSTGVAGWVELGDGQGQFTLRRVAGGDAFSAGLCAGTVEFVRSSGTSAPEVPTCGGAIVAGEGGIAGFGAIPVGKRPVVDLAVDADFEMRSNFASDEATTEYVGVLIGAVSAIYRRDCGITVRLVYLRVFNTPDDIFNDPNPLGQFRDYWNSEGAGITRDLFTLLTGRRNLPYGGVAWLSAACGDFGYSVNGYLNGVFADPVVTNPGNWDINVLAHEIGHNVGTLHTHDYEIDSCASGSVQRGTIMSYCHVVSGASSNIDLRFHRGTVDPIRLFVAKAACLTSDCDGDDVADDEEIAANPALDVNGDLILDACQDCDGNGVPDPVQIAVGELIDADGDGLPDSCEVDCDLDGVPDSIEIAADPSADRDGDMRLDACQSDCNGNGSADAIEIIDSMSLDISRDGRLDSCEDCDGDGVLDYDELHGSRARFVASASDNIIRELDARSGVLRRSQPVGASPANDLAFGPDGRIIHAAIGNRVWAIERTLDQPPLEWSVALSAEVRALAVTPAGDLAALLETGRIDFLNPEGGIISTWAPALAAGSDARDLVFRTKPDGSVDAVVTFAGGVVRRHPWPAGPAEDLANLTELSPQLRGAFALPDGSVLLAASALNAVLQISPVGAYLGEWDVDNGALVKGAYAIADAQDGRAVFVTGPNSTSTINGFRKSNGYTERTYRVYPADAPQATAMVVAPPSESDANGNLIPDECEFSPADLNADGLVNGSDLSILIVAWGACSGCAADIDGNGTVGAADLAILLGLWG